MPKVSSKRQITLPVDQCEQIGIKPGDEYQSLVADGHITIVKKKRGAAKGVIKHVKSNRSMTDDESLFAEPNIVFEDGQTVWQALNDYRQAKPVGVSGNRREADFPDALIVNKAKYCAAMKGEVIGTVYTFDQAAGAIPGTTLP